MRYLPCYVAARRWWCVRLPEMRKASILWIGMIAVVDESIAESLLNATGGIMIGEIVSSRENDPPVRFID
jgi:hypothetical protein